MPDPLRPLQEYHERRLAAKHALYCTDTAASAVPRMTYS